jgi:hypothetical protein
MTPYAIFVHFRHFFEVFKWALGSAPFSPFKRADSKNLRSLSEKVNGQKRSENGLKTAAKRVING